MEILIQNKVILENDVINITISNNTGTTSEICLTADKSLQFRIVAENRRY